MLKRIKCWILSWWPVRRSSLNKAISDYQQLAGVVAAMHASACGEITGPRRGVVEDVWDLRAKLLRLQRAIYSFVDCRSRYSALEASCKYCLRQRLCQVVQTAPEPEKMWAGLETPEGPAEAKNGPRPQLLRRVRNETT
jgi:hypothetical protein